MLNSKQGGNIMTEEEASYINNIIKDMEPQYLQNKMLNIFMMKEGEGPEVSQGKSIDEFATNIQ